MEKSRITFVASSDLKALLTAEAIKSGTSVSELIRRCCQNLITEEERVLLEMTALMQQTARRASKSLDKSLQNAEKLLGD